MGSLVVVIPVGLLTLILFFTVSSSAAGWATLICLAVWNVFALFKSFSIYNSFRNGISISSGEVIAMASQPFVASITLLVIVFLIFVDINKMHLLWFYPLVSIIFELTIGTMAVKKLESFRQDTFQDL